MYAVAVIFFLKWEAKRSLYIERHTTFIHYLTTKSLEKSITRIIQTNPQKKIHTNRI
jgi:hypothetical protein